MEALGIKDLEALSSFLGDKVSASLFKANFGKSQLHNYAFILGPLGLRGGGVAVSGGLHPLLPHVHGALQLAEEQRLQDGRPGEV